MPDTPDNTAAIIRQLRQDLTVSQAQLAAKTGLAVNSIYRYEAGTNTPDAEGLISLWTIAIENGSPTALHFSHLLGEAFPLLRSVFERFSLEQEKSIGEQSVALSPDDRILLMALIKVLRNEDHSTAKDTTVVVVRRALNALLEPWIADAKKELAEQLLRTMPAASPSGKSNADAKDQQAKRERGTAETVGRKGPPPTKISKK